MSRGSLTVVGTGIQVIRHITYETREYIQEADKVFFLVADPIIAVWIKKINPTADSLSKFYKDGEYRMTAYNNMVAHILDHVRQNLNVCAIFYGHPGIFSYPAHEAIRRARAEGFPSRMFPGISSQDCLFADLGIDPGVNGCQSFDATDFLVYRRKFDNRSLLILWQIGVVGEIRFKKRRWNIKQALKILVEVLKKYYNGNHETILYQASQYPICEPIIQHILLDDLMNTEILPISTLYIPPLPSIPDEKMLIRLKLKT